MKNISLFFTIAFTALITSQLFSQTVKKEKYYYENSQNVRMEFEYYDGEKAEITNIVTRDGQTKKITDVDFNSYSFGNKIPHGKCIEFYENGNKKSEVVYKDGILNGNGIIYYESGKLDAQFTFQNGKLNGLFKSFDESGNVVGENTYNEGNRIGTGYYQFSNGNGGTYRFDLKYKSTNDPNSFLADATLTDNGVSGKGEMIIGCIKPKHLEYSYFDIIQNGIWTYYDSNNQITLKETYEKGDLEGIATEYYDNGKVKEEKTYDTYVIGGQNIRASTLATSDNQFLGQKITVIDGLYKVYYENGQVAKEGIAKTLVTPSKENPDKLAQQLYYVGVWKRYDETGKLIQFLNFDDKSNVTFEMNADELGEQQNINLSQSFETLKPILINKYSKYDFYHFDYPLDASKLGMDEYEYGQIKNEALQVKASLIEELKNCSTSDCLSKIDGKLSQILSRLREIKSGDPRKSGFISLQRYGIEYILELDE